MANTDKTKASATTTIAPIAPAAPAAPIAKEAKTEAVKSAVKEIAEDIKAAAKATRKPRGTAKKKETTPRASKKVSAADEQVYIEYNQIKATPDSLIERSKDNWIANGGNAADIKKVRVYVNTNEGMVYYVINDSAGSFKF